MKKNAKKFLSLLLSLMMLFSVMPLALATADEPAYVNTYVGLGDYVAPALGEGGEGEGGAAAAIPAQYSLLDPDGDGDRADSRVPIALRNQNPYGSCWAFSVLAAAESNVITQGFETAEEIDLSELQLIYYMYHPAVDPLGNVTPGEGSFRKDGEMVEGGRSDYAMNVLARWNGLGDESVLPYSETYKVDRGDTYPDTLALQNKYVIRNYYAINNVENRDELKAAIMENGAATVGYSHFYACMYEDGDTANYYSGTDPYNGNGEGGGHAVSIVGWDDAYAKENFAGKHQPENDGAWLIRNSWGAGSGMGGYFWMSYDEKTIDTTSFIAIMQKANPYDNNYYYDGGALYHPSAKVLGAVNKFVAQGDEVLKAVSVVFPEDAEVNYTVRIFVNPADNNFIKNEEPVETTTGTTTFAGLYTIDLDNPVALNEGDTFAVAISADKPVVISYDKNSSASSWFVNNVTWENDSSYFISGTGNLMSMEERGVARIKAYTDNVDENTVTITASDISICLGNTEALAATATPEGTEIKYLSKDESVAVVEDGYVEGVAEGTAKIVAYNEADNARATFTVTVAAHDLEDVEAKAATCTEPGNSAYAQCKNCGKIFIDGEEATDDQIAALQISATGHDTENLVKTDAVDATDYEDGNIEYWYCPACEKYFADEACETEINLADTVIPALYTCEKVNAVDASCTTDGNVEYYIVKDKATGEIVKYVDADFADIALEDTVIPAGHAFTKHDAVAASCLENGTKGNIEYYTCDICGRYFVKDETEEGEPETYTEVAYSATIAYPKHEMTKTAAKAATCTEDGNIQYYTCGVCGRYYKYVTGSTEYDEADLVIPAKGHQAKKIEANEPGCVVTGNSEYYVCKVCGKVFSDEACETLTTEADCEIEALGHDYQGEVTEAPTCVLPGVKTYTCSRCGDSYIEVIPAAGHQYDENDVCTVCGKSKAENEQDPLDELDGPICEYCGRRHGTSWFASFLYAIHNVFKFFKDLFAKIG